jgi:hypothetical protein
MDRAAVPKASVDEHGNFGAGEDDVGATPDARQYGLFNSKAKTSRVQ